MMFQTLSLLCVVCALVSAEEIELDLNSPVSFFQGRIFSRQWQPPPPAPLSPSENEGPLPLFEVETDPVEVKHHPTKDDDYIDGSGDSSQEEKDGDDLKTEPKVGPELKRELSGSPLVLVNDLDEEGGDRGTVPELPTEVIEIHDHEQLQTLPTLLPVPTTTTTRRTTTTKPDPCLWANCHNGGTCEPNLDDARGHRCVCAEGWAGDTCLDVDNCVDHKCKHGQCVNGVDSYTCECDYEWAGDMCNRHCPSYLCQHGGTCRVFPSGDYGCYCRDGWIGQKCDIEVNECRQNPCQNGASCRDLPNDFECRCAEGWTGKDCSTPCHDYFPKCKQWAKEGKCPEQYSVKNFYALHCAESCDMCVTTNETVVEKAYLSPQLEPLRWLIGKWQSNQTFDNIHFPFDFNTTTQTYRYEIVVKQSDNVLMGLPTLSFMSRATSNDVPDETRHRKGFLTVLWSNDESEGLPKVALSSVTSEGLHLIEEGHADNREVNLKVNYVDQQFANAMIPEMLKINLEYDGLWLKQTHHKVTTNGEVKRSTIYLYKVGKN